MSRSRPTDNAPNPAVRWYEWNGEHGTIRHYSKTEKKNLEQDLPFSFLLLDQVSSVGGWNDASESGIYSNAVRDTRQDVLVVKAFKGGTIAEGLYQSIKDRVKAAGGHFEAVCYIAVKGPDGLEIAGLKFKGAALHSWSDFIKDHRKDAYEKALQITTYTEHKKGRILYRLPVLALKDLSPESNHQAVGLDAMLQTYLDDYFKRTRREQAESEETEDHSDKIEDTSGDYSDGGYGGRPLDDDDIPF